MVHTNQFPIEGKNTPIFHSARTLLFLYTPEAGAGQDHDIGKKGEAANWWQGCQEQVQTVPLACPELVPTLSGRQCRNCSLLTIFPSLTWL